jgi:preprotein translocase subunit SecF
MRTGLPVVSCAAGRLHNMDGRVSISPDEATVLSTLALYFLGGPMLHDFAFTILVGIFVGTYSSIFIASPIVLWWSHRTGLKHRESQPEMQVAAH